MSRLILCVLLCWAISTAQASVIIGGTRIIYPADQRQVSIELVNKGDSPALVQSWIDEGDRQSDPQLQPAPFVIIPPLVRVEPERTQALRIMFSGAELPRDRESLFWLNVLEVPPRPDPGQATENYLQFAVRSRIKLFYRPAGLQPDSQSEAARQLVWRREGAELVVQNPSPYHITLTEARIGGQALQVKMLAPYGSERLPLPPEAAGEISYSHLNDYGGRETLRANLSE